MALKDCADVATIIAAIAGVFAVVAALVGVISAIKQTRIQLKDMHLESNKWNALNICAQYELSEIISTAARNLYLHLDYGNAKSAEEEKINELSRDAIIVLNYLDGLFGLDKNDYTFLIAMDGRWRLNKPYYSDGHR